MANRTVKLIWYCRTPGGWRRFPVLTARNGRIRTGVVQQDGQEVSYPEGRFLLRSYEGTRTVYLPAGKTAADAELARQKAIVERRVREDAARIGLFVPDECPRLELRSGSERFVQRTRDAQAHVAAQVYRRALDEFIETVRVRFADEVDGEVMLAFHSSLRRKGNSDRTIANKHNRVCAFLRWAGVDLKSKQIGTPKYEKKLPVVYARNDVQQLRAAIRDRYWRVVLDLLQMTGLREQEAMYLQWADVDLQRRMLRVRSKPELGFRIKDSEERDVPLPDELVETLNSWRCEKAGEVFVLGTDKDRPNTKLLRGLKRLAKNAGLNCGACTGCVQRGECRRWTLHSFRRSYATSLSRAGIDARTIMSLMGHSDLETTMRYLAAMEPEAARSLVNAVAW